jgi:stage V sporulation protein SpoVS
MCICSVWHIFGVCYVFGVLLAITQSARESGCIGAAGRGDVSAAVICHAMSLTVLWLYPLPTETICLPYFTDCPIDFENGLVTLVHHKHVYIYIY